MTISDLIRGFRVLGVKDIVLTFPTTQKFCFFQNCKKCKNFMKIIKKLSKKIVGQKDRWSKNCQKMIGQKTDGQKMREKWSAKKNRWSKNYQKMVGQRIVEKWSAPTPPPPSPTLTPHPHPSPLTHLHLWYSA